jgi:hypothetical protein
LTIHMYTSIALGIIRRGFIAARILNASLSLSLSLSGSLFFLRARGGGALRISQSLTQRTRGVWKILLKSDKSKAAGAGLKYERDLHSFGGRANEARWKPSYERANKSCPFDHRLRRKTFSSALTINQHSY